MDDYQLHRRDRPESTSLRDMALGNTLPKDPDAESPVLLEHTNVGAVAFILKLCPTGVTRF